jgi:hypothetical protein
MREIPHLGAVRPAGFPRSAAGSIGIVIAWHTLIDASNDQEEIEDASGDEGVADRKGFRSRMVEWGGMIVSYEIFPKGVDATPLFKGLPGDMCQAPHWGYVLRGRVRIKTANGDAVLKTGDVYYLEPGHVPVYEEDTEVLEFSPKEEYQHTIDIVNKNIAAAQVTK